MGSMGSPLAERRCVRCEPGTPQLEPAAVQELAAQVPDWKVTEVDGHPVLTRTYRFKGFMPGVDLVNRVAAIAEEEGHHPDVCLGYGYVTVQLWTHAAGGLTDNDFILAAKVDKGESPKS
jgi:4a-hydroxytetrahydrobiopterin dehydratase